MGELEYMPIIVGVLSDEPEAALGGVIDTEDVLSGEISVPTVIHDTIQPATRSTLGGIIVGENLDITPEGVLSVPVASEPEEDNTRPITAAAVYTEIGNISALLATI